MAKSVRFIFLSVCVCGAGTNRAVASFHLVDIVEIYSNACGTVQFIELNVPNLNGVVNTKQLRIYDRFGALTRTLTFTSNVSAPDRFLLATPNFLQHAGVAQNTQLGTLNPGDIDTEGGAIWFACCSLGNPADVIVYGNYIGPNPPPGTIAVDATAALSVPTDGNSLNRSGATFVSGNNTPTSLANQTGHVPSTGDMNGDNVLDSADVEEFVDVLLGNNTNPVSVVRADFDCTGRVDGGDIAGFVEAFLAP